MATEEDDFKIKGAAAERTEAPDSTSGVSEHSTGKEDQAASGSIPASNSDEANARTEDNTTDNTDHQDKESPEEQQRRYRWCRCLCDPLQYGRDHYFLQMETQESRWDEPSEPYWLWDAEKQALDESGLHYPASSSTAQTTSEEADPNYYGYNPKIHGSYDPNAPYAQYHNRKRDEEATTDHIATGTIPLAQTGDYAMAGTFNRFTGNFQTADKSMERHDDYNKSGRQLGAFFDVDAAANSHDGRSLKEERRNEKLSKKQIKELAEKRRAKKEKKRLDFYKS